MPAGDADADAAAPRLLHPSPPLASTLGVLPEAGDDTDDSHDAEAVGQAVHSATLPGRRLPALTHEQPGDDDDVLLEAGGARLGCADRTSVGVELFEASPRSAIPSSVGRVASGARAPSGWRRRR